MPEPSGRARLRLVASPPGPGPSPEALLAEVAKGSGEAFERLYPLLAGAVYSLALRVVRDPGLAQDVSQEVLVDVWRQAPRFDRSRGSAMTWVLTMTHRRAVDRVRRETSQTERMARDADHRSTPEHDVVVAEVERTWEAAAVRRALATLTTLQREAIELAYYHGYTHQQVSTVLEIPLGTAKTRIRDGLIRLRDTMGVDQP
ncbi:MAG: ECF RNA polymerase sigma factor SigK [Cellulomonas sp.]|nr:ECF RNA polymerase sigma factor SigK [Cellulomonas sp.]